MSSSPPFTERTPIKLPAGMWISVLAAAALAGGAWFTTRGDVIRQAIDIENLRTETRRQIQELRHETNSALAELRAEQKSQRELLIRIDENVKRLPR